MKHILINYVYPMHTTTIEDTPQQINRVNKLSTYGPLEIDDYDSFLLSSKAKYIEEWNKKISYQESLRDFDPLKFIGEGNFGKVLLVQHKQTHRNHAMKVIKKTKLIENKRVEHARNEKLVLQSNNSPQTLFLDSFFKDNNYIYFLTPFISGGTTYDHLKKCNKFDETISSFYVAQVVLALEYLHYVNVIYRDVKPENILIDHTGYVKLAGFGLSKFLKTPRTYTFCGTPEYIAPEIIQNVGYGKACDWWSVGILAFELSSGSTPFKHKDVMSMYKGILLGRFQTPTYFTPELQDFVEKTIQVNTSKRFGNLRSGIHDIKQHNWFRLINWKNLFCRKMTAPYIPLDVTANEKNSENTPSEDRKNGWDEILFKSSDKTRIDDSGLFDF